VRTGTVDDDDHVQSHDLNAKLVTEFFNSLDSDEKARLLRRGRLS
jgi:hypothetical protein